MDRQNKSHPLQEGFTQLLRKEARGVYPRRRSWWPGRKEEPHAKESQVREEALDSASIVNVNTSEATNAIRLGEVSAPEFRVHKRVTKSDGGSVGSNLKKLSIDDRRGLQALSPLAAARTKRAAEPSGLIPDSATRPSKRQGQHDRVAPDRFESTQNDKSAKIGSRPGIIQLPQPLPSGALYNFDSKTPIDINDAYVEPTSKGLLRPQTRPITQDQLVNEVKGIYAGLVMVEKKCVEIDQQQSKTTNKLSDDQWQALIALHRTLLYEHHDFFLASQHPSSSAALRRLATKYAMPARMWRHGIHSFLELLRHRLPDSLDHMSAFIYLAYSMMALLMESVPSFVETWIECLGDLARYRMAIEEVDLRDREIWSGCARMWYEKAADKSPNIGRIQHHLAILARLNIVQQLFYYSKALTSVVPFQNARESILLLFSPFFQEGETISQKYFALRAALVTLYGVTNGHWKRYWWNTNVFLSGFDAHIGRTGSKFHSQGPEIVSSLCAAAFDFGNIGAYLTKAFQKDTASATHASAFKESDPSSTAEPELLTDTHSTQQYWKSLDGSEGRSWPDLPSGQTKVGVCRLSKSGVGGSQFCRALSGFSRALKSPLILPCSFPGVIAHPTGTRIAENTDIKLSDLLSTYAIICSRWSPALFASGVAVYVVNRIARRAADPTTRKQTFAVATAVNALAGLVFADEGASAELRIMTIITGLVLDVQYGIVLFPKLISDLRLPIAFLGGGVFLNALLCHMMAASTGVDPALFLQSLLISFWVVLSVASFVQPLFSWTRNELRRILA